MSLRRVNATTLALGTTLPGDIRDYQGRSILRAGLVVDRHLLEAVKTHLGTAFYVGPDWPDDGSGENGSAEADASEVFETLSRQHDAGAATAENRKHERHEWSVSLTLQIVEQDPGGIRHRQLEVMTKNISQGGFAFTYNGYLHPGTEVSAIFATLPGKPHLTGVVRNCTLVSGHQHRVGVQFLQKKKAAG